MEKGQQLFYKAVEFHLKSSVQHRLSSTTRAQKVQQMQQLVSQNGCSQFHFMHVGGFLHFSHEVSLCCCYSRQFCKTLS